MYGLKVIQAIPGMRSSVTAAEVESFLDGKFNLQLGTVDSDGYPAIHPIWFIYDRVDRKFFAGTDSRSRKIANIRKNPRVYFSIDEEVFPYKGVKGRASAKVLEDIGKNVKIIEKINLKYLGTHDHPLARRLIDSARTGLEIVIEITPSYFSAWDFSKAA